MVFSYIISLRQYCILSNKMSIDSRVSCVPIAETGWGSSAISPHVFKIFCSQLIIDTGINCMVMFRFHTALDMWMLSII